MYSDIASGPCCFVDRGHKYSRETCTFLNMQASPHNTTLLPHGRVNERSVPHIVVGEGLRLFPLVTSGHRAKCMEGSVCASVSVCVFSRYFTNMCRKKSEYIREPQTMAEVGTAALAKEKNWGKKTHKVGLIIVKITGKEKN